MRRLGLAVLCVAVPVAAAAQLEYRPGHPGSWTYKSMRALAEPKLSAEERALTLRQLRELGDVIAGTSVILPVRGVEIEAAERLDLGCTNAEPPCALKQVGAWLEVAVMGYHALNGKVVLARDEPPGFTVSINDPFEALHDRQYDYTRLFDARGSEIFMGLAELDKTVGGATVWDNNTVILTRAGRSLTVPVSREAYLRALITRESKAPPVVELLQAELAELTNRNDPAWVGTTETISRLVPPGTTGATPLVSLNPGYFDGNLPRTAVQLITLRFMYGNGFRDGKPTPPEYGPDAIKVWELRQAIDYARLRKAIR